MRPYKNIKLTQSPDVADIQSEGRKTSIGRIPRGDSYTRYVHNLLSRPIAVTCYNDRGYSRPSVKAGIRRQLKRTDRALENRFNVLAEAE